MVMTLHLHAATPNPVRTSACLPLRTKVRKHYKPASVPSSKRVSKMCSGLTRPHHSTDFVSLADRRPPSHMRTQPSARVMIVADVPTSKSAIVQLPACGFNALYSSGSVSGMPPVISKSCSLPEDLKKSATGFAKLLCTSSRLLITCTPCPPVCSGWQRATHGVDTSRMRAHTCRATHESLTGQRGCQSARQTHLSPKH